MMTKIGQNNPVFETDKYAVVIVENPDVEARVMYPLLYKIDNKITGLAESYETMLPNAIIYAKQATKCYEVEVENVKSPDLMIPKAVKAH